MGPRLKKKILRKTTGKARNEKQPPINTTTVKPDLISDEKPKIKHEKAVSNDVSEGKTVFIKNVPFSATNEDLKQCLLQYGPIYYALICIDPLTEHSKGTAFVKFTNKEDAEKCLQAGTELNLQGNVLDCHTALHKHQLQQKEQDKKVKQKDSRNLYLVKEGVILAGTKAAEGVSAADMAKRLQLEQYKTQVLRNLNMYVSKLRLIIHNIPPTWNEFKLKALFKKHSNPTAVIKEVRIMRDLKNVDSKGVGQSKEYGFVSFSTHEDALAVLRSLNNNPTIFSITKRPIIAFSIENRAALKAREKRLQKSKTKNPNYKGFKADADQTSQPEQKSIDFRTGENRSISYKEGKKFSGVNATPGVRKMRSRFNLKTQAKLHHEHLKKEKKNKKKSIKSLNDRKKDFTKQDKQKQNTKQEKDNFSSLVNKYKQSLKSVPLKTAKWYE